MGTILSFKTTFEGTLQIFLLGGIGFLLVRKRFIPEEGLNLLSRLVIEVTLPLLIFSQLIGRFSFSAFPNWWVFPILSLIITASGFVVGKIVLMLHKNLLYKKEFLSLLGFQNSGYLPLILVATILPSNQKEIMFNYLFLFLLGFNLVIWSFGVWFLKNSLSAETKAPEDVSCRSIKNFEFGSLLSPPVLATLISLFLIFMGLSKFIPQLMIKPLKMIGECTLPLAMLVVGGNLAQIKIFKLDKTAVLALVVMKLIFLPVITLLILFSLKVNPLIGLLILLQAAMPSATSLSLIARRYRLEEEFINQGIFLTHIISLITIPFFLGLYGKFAILY